MWRNIRLAFRRGRSVSSSITKIQSTYQPVVRYSSRRHASYRPSSQHASWLSRLVIGLGVTTTGIAMARHYQEAFSNNVNSINDLFLMLDLPQPVQTVEVDNVNREEQEGVVAIAGLEELQPQVDLERAFQLIPVIEEIIEVGGTTLFSQGERDGASVLFEVSDASPSQSSVIIQNSTRFKQRVEELKEQSGELFLFFAQPIIDKATAMGSYSLLKVLSEEQFGLEEQLHNNPVLNHPRAELIESYLDKFHKLGLLTKEHMPLMLAIQEAQALEGEEDLARIELLSADFSDEVEVLRVLLASEQQLAKRKATVKEAFAHTVVLPDSYSYVESTAKQGSLTISAKIGDYNPLITSEADFSQRDYDVFFDGLKREARSQGEPIDGYGILCGSHFTCFATQVERGDDGKFTVRLLSVDTLRTDLSSFSGSKLLPSIKRVFGEEVQLELHSSSDFIQSRGVGCSYHAPFILERLRELPDWLAEHESAYAELPTEQRLWAYLADNAQQPGQGFTSDTVIHYFKDHGSYHQERLDKLPEVFKATWHGVTLPLHFSENKESFDKARNVSSDNPVLRELVSPYRVVEEQKLGDLLAQQGLVVNLKKGAPRAHQQHYRTRSYRTLDVKFNDALDRKTELRSIERPDGSVFLKRMNRGVDAYREQIRGELTEFLLFMPVEELEQLTTRYSLEEFELRVCDRVTSRGGSAKKSMRHTFFAMVEEADKADADKTASTGHTPTH